MPLRGLHFQNFYADIRPPADKEILSLPVLAHIEGERTLLAVPAGCFRRAKLHPRTHLDEGALEDAGARLAYDIHRTFCFLRHDLFAVPDGLKMKEVLLPLCGIRISAAGSRSAFASLTPANRLNFLRHDLTPCRI